jgi:hypothetical protein
MIMKKTIIITVVGLLMLAFAATMVSAGPNPGRMCPFGNQATLTDAQKEEMAPLVNEMKDLHVKMGEVMKQMIQKQVGFGNMTQAQADEHITRMEANKSDGPGMGMMGRGHGKGEGMGQGMGHGMMNDCPVNK